ncbi:hypothetical protein LFM09_41255 [Lentzea alba]|uniref:hypothetical protein n=1 Tax=Lentzea alba TaxID=2714351 RepID=UPI0039BF483F
MSRIGIVLGVVAVVAAFAAPAVADTATDRSWVEPARHQVEPVAPETGKCMYWLVGETSARECHR